MEEYSYRADEINSLIAILQEPGAGLRTQNEREEERAHSRECGLASDFAAFWP